MTTAPSPSLQVQAEASRPFRPSRFGERFGLQLDPALRAEVGNEQLNMVLGHTRLGTLVATAFAVFLALQLRGVAVPAWVVDGWLVVKLGVAAAPWAALAALIAERDPHCRGAVILGLNQPIESLAAAFAQATNPIVKGFMVGRTIWGEASVAWLRGEIDDEALVRRCAERYGALVQAWRTSRPR